MGKTAIEWAEHSVNPIRARDVVTGKVGHWCEKISPGCTNCYSSALQLKRFHKHEFVVKNRDKVEVYLERKVLDEVLRRQRPTRYFWGDMTDMFGPWVPDEWLSQCVATMGQTLHHTHMMLTKRSERMYEYFKVRHGWAPPNLWLGVSVENQAAADERISMLLRIQSVLRFLSVEPLLGSVDLRLMSVGEDGVPRRTSLGWVIVGGESGTDARECDPAWIRDIVQQCEVASVPVFVKQFGARPIGLQLKHPKGGDIREFPDDLRKRQIPTT